MTGSLARAAPVRFLVGVTLAWTVGRGVALAGWRPDAVVLGPIATMRRSPMPLRPIFPMESVALDGSAIPVVMPPLLRRVGFVPLAAQPEPRWRTADEPLRIAAGGDGGVAPLLVRTASAPTTYRRASGLVAARGVTGTARRAARFSGSAWAFFRGGGRARALSPVGQIGGGQAGARLLYAVDPPDRLALSARVSRTIGGIRQAEAAVGLDWKPLASLPVHLMLERRIAIDKGGRNAWTLGTAGGVDDVRIAPGWRLDGYGEAGVVGARRRDLYADGAARIARALDLGGGRSLSLGGGAWGAAQPHAARLDLGPSAVLRAPVAGRTLAVALDWRERVAGAAKPGSGVALTVATDF